ncbi:hypothetical protein ATE48_07575 [Candidatus Viadribacter manganicus]|uniref:Uncharacterized protein n=1 Tax=Candidatus Viadribacter manganicus TaxID=1759059 RepID=A0A1B1AGX1_9PROT|nr:hypothetical protein ATE48_07575 [Candidatus Viadribacter manganicus]
MPWFEIIYSEDVSSKALSSNKVAARDRTEAAATAMRGFANARTTHGAKCFRVIDGLGMVVARGPKGISKT